MASVVEFLIKMQDGLTSPLAKITQTSGSAKTALGRLSESGKKLNTVVAESGTSVVQLNNKIAKLKEYRDLLPSSAERQIRAINSEINHLNSNINRLQSISGNKVKGWFSEAFEGIPGIVRNPVILAAAGLGATFNEGLKQSREKLDFKLLLGASAGEEMYAGLKSLKPILGDSVQTTAKDLLSVGVAAERVRPLMGQLAAASRGDVGKFNALSGAFKEMQKEGKLTEAALSAMKDAGFDPLSMVSEKYGVKMTDLKQKLSDGVFSIEMVNEALTDATAQGGKFGNVLTELGKEPSVMLSLLMVKVSDLAGRLGGLLIPAVTGVVSLFSDLLDWGKENEDMLLALGGAVLGGVLAYKAYQGAQVLSYMWMMRETIATSALATAKGVLAIATGGLTVATGALNAIFIASPIGWIVGGLALLTGGIVLAWNKSEGFRKVLFGLWEAAKTVFGNIKKFFGKLLGLDGVGEYENIGEAWGKGLAKGAASFKKSQEQRKSQKATDAHFGTSKGFGGSSFTDSKSDGSMSKVNDGINAVSGGGAQNSTIQIGKMVEKLEIRIVGGTQQVAQEMEQMIEEVMVRAIASATRRN